jgi:hypothetical protein
MEDSTIISSKSQQFCENRIPPDEKFQGPNPYNSGGPEAVV